MVNFISLIYGYYGRDRYTEYWKCFSHTLYGENTWLFVV